MASPNAAPIDGSELIKVIQDGWAVYLNRTQFAQILAVQAKYYPRPFKRPTTLLGTELFEAVQKGSKITMNAADVSAFLNGTAPIPSGFGTQPTPFTGIEQLPALQSLYEVGLNLTDLATVLGGGGPVTDIPPGGSGLPAPIFTTLPSISPSSGAIGATFTRTAGVVTNGSITSWRWLLNGSPLAGAVASVTANTSGSLTVEDTASGAGGVTIRPSAAVTVSSGTGPNPKLVLTFIGSNPQTTYPPPVYIANLPPYLQPGDVLQLFYDAAQDVSGSNFLPHTLTNADATPDGNGNLPPINFGLASVAGMNTGVHAFAVQPFRSGSPLAPISDTIIHGDTVAPSISSVTANGVENQPILETINFSEKVAAITFGGTDGSKLTTSTTLPAQSLVIVPVGGANLNYETSSGGQPSYSYTVTVTDRSGNTSSPLARNNVPVIDQDEVPDSFSFAPVGSNATASTVYTAAETITISGLGSGVSAPVTVSGPSAQYQKNGGTWTSSAGSVVNGDTLRFRITTGSSNATYLGTMNVGDPPVSANYSVRVGSPVTLDPSAKGGSIVLSNNNLTAADSGANNIVHFTRTLVQGTGLYYFEVTLNSSLDSSTHGAGIGEIGETLTGNISGYYGFPPSSHGATIGVMQDGKSLSLFSSAGNNAQTLSPELGAVPFTFGYLIDTNAKTIGLVADKLTSNPADTPYSRVTLNAPDLTGNIAVGLLPNKGAFTANVAGPFVFGPLNSSIQPLSN